MSVTNLEERVAVGHGFWPLEVALIICVRPVPYTSGALKEVLAGSVVLESATTSVVLTVEIAVLESNIVTLELESP